MFRLLNSTRGWDSRHTPVHDVHWALEQIADRFGVDCPTCLVGHSLGGRAAILSVNQRSVRGAVALAAWVYPDDVPLGIEGRPILMVHGDRDRVASPDRAAALARRLASVTEVKFVLVPAGKHAMLRHHARFENPAAGFVTDLLLREPDTNIEPDAVPAGDRAVRQPGQ